MSGGEAEPESGFALSAVGTEVGVARAEFVGCSVGSGDGDFAGVAVEADVPASFVDSGVVPST
jgi:hypothetical protein